MTLLELLQAWLPLLVVLNSVGSAVIVWAVRRASKSELAAVADRCTAHEARLVKLEQNYSMLPTREDSHLLRLQMMEFAGQMASFTQRIDMDRRQVVAEVQSARELFDRQIEATEGLVERTEKNLRLITEHLLNKGM